MRSARERRGGLGLRWGGESRRTGPLWGKARHRIARLPRLGLSSPAGAAHRRARRPGTVRNGSPSHGESVWGKVRRPWLGGDGGACSCAGRYAWSWRPRLGALSQVVLWRVLVAHGAPRLASRRGVTAVRGDSSLLAPAGTPKKFSRHHRSSVHGTPLSFDQRVTIHLSRTPETSGALFMNFGGRVRRSIAILELSLQDGQLFAV